LGDEEIRNEREKNMKTFQYRITDEAGIHARPAGELSKLAKEFSSKAEISAEGKSADASRLMAVMGLGIKKGTEVTVSVAGKDEDVVAERLKTFFEQNL
jgi:phosphocarrier protein